MNKRLITSRLIIGLGLSAVAAATTAAPVDLITPSAWIFYATGSVQGGTLTVGDSVGYDTSDSDRDNNPYNAWFGTGATTGQGVDYDEAITVAEFTPPMSVTWTGCLPETRYGYNNIFIGRKNVDFKGATGSRQYPINQEFGFTNRWDYSGLNTVVLNVGRHDVQRVSAATLSNNKYCGDYRVDWANDTLDFYFNGSKVRTQKYTYLGPVSILVRSFDLSHTITSMKVDAATSTAQKPATDTGLASIYGANITGSLTHKATGNKTDLNTSNSSVSGDVTFATNGAGNLVAHVSGKGAAIGVAFRYDVDYDTATGNLSGTVTDNTTNTPLPIVFTYKGNLTWRATLSGSNGRSSSGGAADYELAFDIVLPAESIRAGRKFPPGGRFVADLSQQQAITIPISVPVINVNTTLATNIVTEGELVVTLVPKELGNIALTGDVDGSFRMDPPVSFSTVYNVPSPFPGITIPPVNINVVVDAIGRFSGTLSGEISKNNLRFTGNWSGVSSDGTTAGGTLDMPIPLDPKTGDVPTTALMTVEGVVTLNIGGIPTSVPITLPSSMAFSQQVVIPISFRQPN
ncbi:MAG: hypothetical protein Q7V56_10195 [Gammaproteobacteria bacterium]|nr:hypothetical protein [Gammaproteobacteria bacterium]